MSGAKVALTVLVVAAALPARAAQCLFWEATHEYKKDGVMDGRLQWNPSAECPCDWTSPANYKDGTLHIRVEVLSMSKNTPFKWHFFMFRPGESNCQGRDSSLTHKGVSRNTITGDKPGTYTADVKVSSMNSYAKSGSSPLPWDWKNAVSRAGRNFANTEDTDSGAFPMKCRIKVWLVSAGSTFDDGGGGGTTNNPPAAKDQSVTVAEGSSKSITLSYTDDGPAPYAFTITQQPAHGKLSGTGQSVTYTPSAGYSGSDSFKWRVADGKGLQSNEATVAITVQPRVNAAPVAKDGAVSVMQGDSVAVTLNYSDPDGPSPYTFTITQEPSHGSLSGNAPSLTYTPAAGYSGSDSVKWKVSDGEGAVSGVATVTISVAQNQAPTAANATAEVVQGGTVEIRLVYSDRDGPEQCTVTITQEPQSGTLSVSGALWTYEPDSGFSGQDTFKWKAYDGLNYSPEATVTISVEADSDGDGLPDSWETLYGLNPSSDDTDADGTNDGQEDEDFDGRTNLEEYARGSSPLASDASSSVGVLACSPGDHTPATATALLSLALMAAAACLVKRTPVSA